MFDVTFSFKSPGIPSAVEDAIQVVRQTLSRRWKDLNGAELTQIYEALSTLTQATSHHHCSSSQKVRAYEVLSGMRDRLTREQQSVQNVVQKLFPRSTIVSLLETNKIDADLVATIAMQPELSDLKPLLVEKVRLKLLAVLNNPQALKEERTAAIQLGLQLLENPHYSSVPNRKHIYTLLQKRKLIPSHLALAERQEQLSALVDTLSQTTTIQDLVSLSEEERLRHRETIGQLIDHHLKEMVYSPSKDWKSELRMLVHAFPECSKRLSLVHILSSPHPYREEIAKECYALGASIDSPELLPLVLQCDDLRFVDSLLQIYASRGDLGKMLLMEDRNGDFPFETIIEKTLAPLIQGKQQRVMQLCSQMEDYLGTLSPYLLAILEPKEVQEELERLQQLEEALLLNRKTIEREAEYFDRLPWKNPIAGILKKIDTLKTRLLKRGDDSDLFDRAEYVLGNQDKWQLLSKEMAQHPIIAQVRQKLGDDSFRARILNSILSPIRIAIDKERFTAPEIVETLIAYGFNASAVRELAADFKNKIYVPSLLELSSRLAMENEQATRHQMSECMITKLAHELLSGSNIAIDEPILTKAKALIMELVAFHAAVESESAKLFQQHSSSILATIESDPENDDVRQRWAAMHGEFASYLSSQAHYHQLTVIRDCFAMVRPKMGEEFTFQEPEATERVRVALEKLPVSLSRDRFKADEAWPKLWKEFYYNYPLYLLPYFQEHQQFSFSQDIWDKDDALHYGVCTAVNYRMARQQIKNPDRQFTCAKDIEVSEDVQGIRSKDRFTQAAHVLNTSFHHMIRKVMPDQAFRAEDIRQIQDYDIPKFILHQDGLQPAKSLSGPSFLALIKQLDASWNETCQLKNSFGVLFVSMYDKTFGHAMGIRIDPSRNIFSFWDPNNGYYTFSSKEELLFAFNEFCKLYYSNFPDFTIAQYVPAPPAAPIEDSLEGAGEKPAFLRPEALKLLEQVESTEIHDPIVLENALKSIHDLIATYLEGSPPDLESAVEMCQRFVSRFPLELQLAHLYILQNTVKSRALALTILEEWIQDPVKQQGLRTRTYRSENLNYDLLHQFLDESHPGWRAT